MNGYTLKDHVSIPSGLFLNLRVHSETLAEYRLFVLPQTVRLHTYFSVLPSQVELLPSELLTVSLL